MEGRAKGESQRDGGVRKAVLKRNIVARCTVTCAFGLKDRLSTSLLLHPMHSVMYAVQPYIPLLLSMLSYELINLPVDNLTSLLQPRKRLVSRGSSTGQAQKSNI